MKERFNSVLIATASNEELRDRPRSGDAEFPELNALSAVLLDLDGLMLSETKRALIADLGRAASWVHDVLDGAAILLSSLAAADLDAAFAPARLPMLASNGWERRWRGGYPLVTDPSPTGTKALYERLAAFVALDAAIRVRQTACGVEVDLSKVAGGDVAGRQTEIVDALRRTVSSRVGFRLMQQGARAQVVPINLRKNHLVELLSDHEGFRGRQWIYVYDGDDADGLSRMVQRRGGTSLRVQDGSTPGTSARSWEEMLAWLCREAVALEGHQRSAATALSSEAGE